MSNDSTFDESSVAESLDPAASEGTVLRRVPVLIGLLIITYWATRLILPSIEMGMFQRFGTRCLAWIILVVASLVWWLWRSGFSRRVRWLIPLALIGETLVTVKAAHESVNIVDFLMQSWPVAITATAIWLVISRRHADAFAWRGILCVSAISIGAFTLFRWNGIDGVQQAELHWRWEPSPEERFLSENSAAKSSTGETPALTLQDGDWPEFLGSDRLGRIEEYQFSDAEPRELWRRRVGPAWSSMIIVDRRLFTQEQRGTSEAVVCYDSETGAELWAHTDVLRFDESVSGTGPRATPTFHEGRLYSAGATGLVNCLNASNGSVVWAHNVLEDSHGPIPQWGYSSSPLVVNDLLVVHGGGSDRNAWLGLELSTGKVKWSVDGGPQTYSSPQVVTICGVKQLLLHDNKRLAGVNPEDGQVHWSVPQPDEYQIPMLQPRVVDDHSLLVSFEPNLALLDVQFTDSNWSVGTRWSTHRMKAGFNEFAIVGEGIVGLDDGILAVLDLRTGQRLWKKERCGHGQLLQFERQVLVTGEKGEVSLWRFDDVRAPQVVWRSQVLRSKTWNHAAFAHGVLYVRNAEEMVALR